MLQRTICGWPLSGSTDTRDSLRVTARPPELCNLDIAVGPPLRRFIDSGLFAFSRHPNYFGEILAWTGVWLTAGFPTLWMQFPWIAASPGFTALLLLYVSGVPSLVAHCPGMSIPTDSGCWMTCHFLAQHSACCCHVPSAPCAALFPVEAVSSCFTIPKALLFKPVIPCLRSALDARSGISALCSLSLHCAKPDVQLQICRGAHH